MPPEVRRRAALEWGVPVRGVYATTELGVVAFECDQGTYHVALPNVEAIDANPETGDAIIVVSRLPRVRRLGPHHPGDNARGLGAACNCPLNFPAFADSVARVNESNLRPLLNEAFKSSGITMLDHSVSDKEVQILVSAKEPCAPETLAIVERKLKSRFPGIAIRITQEN